MSEQAYPGFHDTLRTLVRGHHWPSELEQQRALYAIDANEAGAESTDAYVKEQQARAAQARRDANPNGPESQQDELARLRAENERYRAQVGASAPRSDAEQRPAVVQRDRPEDSRPAPAGQQPGQQPWQGQGPGPQDPWPSQQQGGTASATRTADDDTR